MIQLDAARDQAESLIKVFSPHCSQISIAGSIRRGKPEMKDIEIVAIPKTRQDLFGAPLDEKNGIDLLIDSMVKEGALQKRMNDRGTPQAYGQKFKALVSDGMPLDLFLVTPPAQWGAVLAIRTGPGDFSRMLVTECRRFGYQCTEGRLVYVQGGKTFETPTETEFFMACGVKWIPPEERR